MEFQIWDSTAFFIWRYDMQMTQEQLQREYDYFMAEKITKDMLKNGLITEGEFNKITALNRKIFSPNLAELMP